MMKQGCLRQDTTSRCLFQGAGESDLKVSRVKAPSFESSEFGVERWSS